MQEDGGIGTELKNIDPNSPQVKAADAACKSLMPQGGQGGGTTSQSTDGLRSPGGDS
jgi:hypothetical protein